MSRRTGGRIGVPKTCLVASGRPGLVTARRGRRRSPLRSGEAVEDSLGSNVPCVVYDLGLSSAREARSQSVVGKQPQETARESVGIARWNKPCSVAMSDDIP